MVTDIIKMGAEQTDVATSARTSLSVVRNVCATSFSSNSMKDGTDTIAQKTDVTPGAATWLWKATIPSVLTVGATAESHHGQLLTTKCRYDMRDERLRRSKAF